MGALHQVATETAPEVVTRLMVGRPPPVRSRPAVGAAIAARAV